MRTRKRRGRKVNGGTSVQLPPPPTNSRTQSVYPPLPPNGVSLKKEESVQTTTTSQTESPLEIVSTPANSPSVNTSDLPFFYEMDPNQKVIAMAEGTPFVISEKVFKYTDQALQPLPLDASLMIKYDKTKKNYKHEKEATYFYKLANPKTKYAYNTVKYGASGLGYVGTKGASGLGYVGTKGASGLGYVGKKIFSRKNRPNTSTPGTATPSAANQGAPSDTATANQGAPAGAATPPVPAGSS